MVFTAKALKGYSLQSFDWDIGRVKEFYFRRVLDRSPSGRSHRLLAQ